MRLIELDPRRDQPNTCPDTQLRLTFDSTPQVTGTGRIRLYDEFGEAVDRLDPADPDVHRRNVGGARNEGGGRHFFTYDAIAVHGRTVVIAPHHRLEYGRTYTAEIDDDVIAGFAGLRWGFSTRPDPPAGPILRVASAGPADFRTVQGAIDAIPAHNHRRAIVDVRPGEYRELIYVRPDKPYITVRGRDRERTVIRYVNNELRNGRPDDPEDRCPCRRLDVPDRYNCWRASFGVDASDFRLENITVRNDTPMGGSQAEAFRGNGERIALDRVVLTSFQDTLRLQGSGFVDDSVIEGDTDFVWGVGMAFVRNSELRWLRVGVAAQVRNGAERHGNVFVDCRLTRVAGVPDASSHLARIDADAYPHSHVAFLGCVLDDHIHPAGWQIRGQNTNGTVRFAEHGSIDPAGRRIDTRHRHPAARQLSDAEAERWRDPAIVLDGWSPT